MLIDLILALAAMLLVGVAVNFIGEILTKNLP